MKMLKSVRGQVNRIAYQGPARRYVSESTPKTPLNLSVDETPRPSAYTEHHPSFVPKESLGKRRVLAYVISSCITGFLIYSVGFERLFAEEAKTIVDPDNDMITSVPSDHDPLKHVKENIGVYVWGTNSTKLCDPESTEVSFRQPSALKYFKGKILRDLAFSDAHAVAVDEHGDVYQWGSGHRQESAPHLTLKNRNIIQAVCTDQSTFLLSKNGVIYSLKASFSEQENSMNSKRASLKPSIFNYSYWFSSAEEQCLDKFYGAEKIIKLAAGKQHLYALSKNGRIYSIPCAAEGNAYGQLGLGINTQMERQLHAVPTSSPVTDIVCGDHHTLFSTKDGKIFGVGYNEFGQLGTGINGNIPKFISTPTEIQTLWSRFNKIPKPNDTNCVKIAAGGMNSYFVIKSPNGGELLSCGSGINGQLGNGSYNHIQPHPVKVKRFSELVEWDEYSHTVKPIDIHAISCSSTHTVATLSDDRIAGFGRDVFIWGLNQKGELYRLDGKKSASATPVWAHAIDFENMGEKAGRLAMIPKMKVNGTWVEQKVVCGPSITAVYMKVL